MRTLILNKAGLDGEVRKRVVALAKVAVECFNSEDWQALGVHAGQLDVITRHDRLLRSLSFNVPDYAGNANAVLFRLVEIDRTNLDIIA
ncbi:hypothetical protein [Paracoccus sp. SM22M-07]|uniref:hypothetical protein n=1 Tax=Paracoccus sp. SM22M-07 TaxID=1520813 RepID=UPI001480AB09